MCSSLLSHEYPCTCMDVDRRARARASRLTPFLKADQVSRSDNRRRKYDEQQRYQGSPGGFTRGVNHFIPWAESVQLCERKPEIWSSPNESERNHRDGSYPQK